MNTQNGNNCSIFISQSTINHQKCSLAFLEDQTILAHRTQKYSTETKKRGNQSKAHKFLSFSPPHLS